MVGFWKRWRTEYLQELRESHRTLLQRSNSQISNPITEGKVVIIFEKGAPKNSWRLGRIEQVVVSSDGMIQSALIWVSSKGGHTTTLQCPVQRLYPLEVELTTLPSRNVCLLSLESQVNKQLCPLITTVCLSLLMRTPLWWGLGPAKPLPLKPEIALWAVWSVKTIEWTPLSLCVCHLYCWTVLWLTAQQGECWNYCVNFLFIHWTYLSVYMYILPKNYYDHDWVCMCVSELRKRLMINDILVNYNYWATPIPLDTLQL